MNKENKKRTKSMTTLTSFTYNFHHHITVTFSVYDITELDYLVSALFISEINGWGTTPCIRIPQTQV